MTVSIAPSATFRFSSSRVRTPRLLANAPPLARGPPPHRGDGTHDNTPHHRTGQRDGGCNHECEMERAGAFHDTTREPRCHDAGQIADTVLNARPAAGR